MANGKWIAIVGATGAQGGGLARSILADDQGELRVRALTRDPGSDRARRLAAAGAAVVAADADDPESLTRAFDGAYAAFCVTAFWEHFSPERETAQARAMARAAKVAGLEHVIWSTLEDTRRWVPLDDDRMPTLMEHYKVPHFDAKGEADHHFTELGVPTTFLLTSFYWDNFIHLGAGPQRGPDGALTLTLPIGNAKLPGIAAADIGGCAHGILRRGPELAGRTLGIAGDKLTGAEMAASLTRALGEEVRFADVPPEVYRTFGFPGAEDLANMYQFKRDFEEAFCGARSVEQARELHPGLLSLDDWLTENAVRIPLG